MVDTDVLTAPPPRAAAPRAAPEAPGPYRRYIQGKLREAEEASVRADVVWLSEDDFWNDAV